MLEQINLVVRGRPTHLLVRQAPNGNLDAVEGSSGSLRLDRAAAARVHSLLFRPASDTLSSMDELDITREQAEKLRDRVGEMVRYLSALRRRLDDRHFPQNDRFRQRVEWAYDAVHGLWVTLHYMSCRGSVGDSRRP